jgi:hypothetical protein
VSQEFVAILVTIQLKLVLIVSPLLFNVVSLTQILINPLVPHPITNLTYVIMVGFQYVLIGKDGIVTIIIGVMYVLRVVMAIRELTVLLLVVQIIDAYRVNVGQIVLLMQIVRLVQLVKIVFVLVLVQVNLMEHHVQMTVIHVRMMFALAKYAHILPIIIVEMVYAKVIVEKLAAVVRLIAAAQYIGLSGSLHTILEVYVLKEDILLAAATALRLA